MYSWSTSPGTKGCTKSDTTAKSSSTKQPVSPGVLSFRRCYQKSSLRHRMRRIQRPHAPARRSGGIAASMFYEHLADADDAALTHDFVSIFFYKQNIIHSFLLIKFVCFPFCSSVQEDIWTKRCYIGLYSPYSVHIYPLAKD